jgi:DNA polymerase II small subunit/DNA polymerase delta subunit B
MKNSYRILCIKDFGDRFKKGRYYKIDFADEIKVVVEYPLSEIDKIYKATLEFDIDNRVCFYRDKRTKPLAGSNQNFQEYFSDRETKLKKLNEI